MEDMREMILKRAFESISRTQFEEIAFNIFNGINGKINKITQPFKLDINWNTEDILDDSAPCGGYIFPSKIILNGYSVILASFVEDEYEKMMDGEYVKKCIITALLFIITHELSHSGQRVNYIEVVGEFYENDENQIYRMMTEESNDYNTIKFIMRNLKSVSNLIGFTPEYCEEAFTLSEGNSYEELTMFKYYRQIAENILGIDYEDETLKREIINTIDLYERTLVYENVSIILTINGNSIPIKVVSEEFISFTSPDKLNEFMDENFVAFPDRLLEHLHFGPDKDDTPCTLEFSVEFTPVQD